MRVVLDTNIIISGYLGGSLEAVIVAWKSGKFSLVVSAAIVAEYLEVLRRPKFKIEYTEIEDFSALLLDKADFVIPIEKVDAVVDDASDNKFLEAALAGGADLVVSGDAHLLGLKKFRGIPIVSVRDFMTRFKL